MKRPAKIAPPTQLLWRKALKRTRSRARIRGSGSRRWRRRRPGLVYYQAKPSPASAPTTVSSTKVAA